MSDVTEENVEKREREDKAAFVPMGVTSFSELDQAEEAMVIAEKSQELLWNFNDLVWNIMHETEVTDKSGAIRQLADEFADRVGAIEVDDKAALKQSDMKKLDEGKLTKVFNAVKEAFGVETDPRNVLIFKDETGHDRWVGRYSNNYRDNDNPQPEIISEKSHKNFVRLVDAGLAPSPELWLWHEKSLALGQSDWVAYDDSGFAIAGGHFYPGTEGIVKEIKQLDDVAMSHGMPVWSIIRALDDESIIDGHITEEISLLTGKAAANKLTGFVILKEEQMAISTDKRNELLDWGITPEQLSILEQMNAAEAVAADKAGVQSKELTDETEEPATEEAADEAANTEEVAEGTEEAATEPTNTDIAHVLSETMKSVINLSERLKSIEDNVDALARDDATKVAAKAAGTPMASMAELMRHSVVGNEDARVDGRTTLAKSAPKETPAYRAESGIPFIDAMINNDDRKNV